MIGPGIAKVAHTPNENLELNQFLDAIRIYALLALRALARSSTESQDPDTSS